jgi:hypothetical protein
MTLDKLTKVTRIGISSDLELVARSADFSGICSASQFFGDGSGITGVTGSGSGVVVRDNDSPIGTAGTINFSTNLNLTPISSGITTVTSTNTTYSQSSVSDSGNVNLRLTGSDLTNDDILLTAGSNVTFSDITADGFTISATGSSDVVDDTTPQLGGNLDLNGKSITGSAATITATGDVNVIGVVTATQFHGDASNLTSIPSGQLTGALPALDGSQLTGVTATGSGIEVRDSGSTVGTAATVDFSTNLTVSAISAGIVTVTASAGAVVGINTLQSSFFNRINATGVITAAQFVRDGGSSSQFLKADGSVDSSTYLTAYTETDPVVAAINGIVKSNGSTISAATAGTDYLSPSGDASSLTGISTNIAGTWILQSGDGSNYGISGPGLDGTESDPTLYLIRGQEYRFTNNTGGHPFRIQTTVNGSVGTQYNDGITNNDAGNGETLYWRVQFDAPDALYYQCTTGGHGSMGGKINIIGGGNWRMNSSSEVYTNENVGIGTDNPERTLSVAANNPMIQIEGTGGSGKQWSIISSDDTTGAAAASRGGNFVIYDDTSGGLGDVLTLTGIGGSMGLGVQNPGAKLHVSGGNIKVDSGYGIDFSATANSSGTMESEILKDYEEGTWTPTYLAASGDITSAINQGVYVKVGNAVHFSFRLGSTMSSFTGVSGQVKLAGLPFTVGSSTQQRLGGGSIDEMYRWPTNFANFRGYPETGTTAIGLHIMDPNSSAYVNLQVSDMNTGTNQNIIAMSGWYTTTDF